MFTRSPKLSEAQKTQIIIDYLTDELAIAHITGSVEHTVRTDQMLKIQRKKLDILKRKFRKKK